MGSSSAGALPATASQADGKRIGYPERAKNFSSRLGAIFATLALRDQMAPPTLNLSAPDQAGDGIDFVANEARPMEMDYAISNGFGFGGVNASALFRRWTEDLTGAGTGGPHD
jgi:3-oxoacyl-[acyl-carrier-protein] synthase II